MSNAVRSVQTLKTQAALQLRSLSRMLGAYKHDLDAKHVVTTPRTYPVAEHPAEYRENTSVIHAYRHDIDPVRAAHRTSFLQEDIVWNTMQWYQQRYQFLNRPMGDDVVSKTTRWYRERFQRLSSQ
eukprot:m.114576 g.114576  ORF g.114576 m.114576 type:complete len:126 (-) comp28361_c2_seq1:92-469(-)